MPSLSAQQVCIAHLAHQSERRACWRLVRARGLEGHIEVWEVRGWRALERVWLLVVLERICRVGVVVGERWRMIERTGRVDGGYVGSVPGQGRATWSTTLT